MPSVVVDRVLAVRLAAPPDELTEDLFDAGDLPSPTSLTPAADAAAPSPFAQVPAGLRDV